MIFDWANREIVDDQGFRNKMTGTTYPRYVLSRLDGVELTVAVRRYDTRTSEITTLLEGPDGRFRLNAAGDDLLERSWFCACQFIERDTGAPASFDEVRRFALGAD